MNIIAIDTAAEKFSTALAKENDTWLMEVSAGMRHSELIMDCIDALMKKAELRPEDLSAVVCMGGPGSFTGLRIGFALAKGLAISLNIPFAPLPTLDCIAWPFSSWPGIVIPVIDAKKSAFFCAMYSGGKKLCQDMDVSAIEILSNEKLVMSNEKLLFVGPGTELLHERLSELSEPIPANIIFGKDLRYGNAETLLKMAKNNPDIFADSEKNLMSGPEYIRKSISN